MRTHINFGLTKSEFLNEVLERDIHIARGAVSPSLVNWDDVNRAMYCVNSATPFVKLHHEGLVPEERYVEDHSIVGMADKRLNQKALYEYMRKGATLVLNRMDARFEIVRRLCAEVASFGNAETLANGYIAFSGNGSFGNHWDTHDVMAIQLIGRKHWKVYKPTFPLPLAGQTSKHHKHECTGEPVFDGVLEAGDLLYIPRGWWHNAMPIGETFHVAIGIHTPAVLHYVKWLCLHVLGKHVELRQSIRPGVENFDLLPLAVDVLNQEMVDPRNFSAFIDELRLSTHAFDAPFAMDIFGRPAVVESERTSESVRMEG